MEVFVERSARYYRRYLADVISQPVKWELQLILRDAPGRRRWQRQREGTSR